MPELPTISRLQRPLVDLGSERPCLVQAEYFTGQIDLRTFAAQHPNFAVHLSNPLILEPEKGSFIYLERFGSVIFWDCRGELVQSLLEELKELKGIGDLDDKVRDSLTVMIGSAQDRLTFQDVWIGELTLGKLRILSLALSQSVALEHFESAVSQAMAKFQPIVEELELKGHLHLSPKEVLRIIAFAMKVRAAVLQNLTLFDDPPETWESESLAHLDGALYDHFDLEERLSAINQKLAYLRDAGASLQEVLNNRINHRLEWIIIVLIAVEIVFFLWEKMLPKTWPF